jgi:uncharacterized membrane protein
MRFVDWLVTVGLSAAPVSELRGGLPFALAHGAHPVAAYFVAVSVNCLVVPFILVGLAKGERILRRFSASERALDWVFARTQRKASWVRRLGPAALILLVAIPAPGTGAWTGATAAFLFGVVPRRALPPIAVGVMMAGILVLLASLGLFSLVGIG